MPDGNSTPEINPRLPLKQLSRRSIAKRAQLTSAQLAATQSKLEVATRYAMIDPKTELHNDRWLRERVGNAIRESQRTGKPFWLLFMDYDDFKAINSRFDHTGGDQVLRLMRQPKTRPGEEIARFGGDEFTEVLNDDITMEEAVNVARRNAEVVETESRVLLPTLRVNRTDTEPIERVTLSLGLVESRTGLNVDELLALGSQTMDKGKVAGKNTIVAQPAQGDTVYISRIPEAVVNV